jgi:cytochrome c oxidase subunit 4
MSDATHVSREPEEPHGTTIPTPHHAVNYYAIFAALVVLTIVTVLVAFHRFQSEAINLLLAMIVAVTKASLVAMFFMHLKFEGKLIYVIFIVPLILCVLLTVALIPDVLLPAHGTHNVSLHLFNFDWLQELIKGAVGAE